MFLAERSVGAEEVATDVEIEHHLVVGQLGEALVDLIVDLTEVIAVIRAAGEDCQQEDFRVGQLLPQLVHDGLHTRGGFLRQAAVGIARSGHHHGQLGRDAINVAMIQPPENVLRAIAADAQVDGVAFAVELLPHRLACSFPALRDRIADEDQVDVALLHAGIDLFVLPHPAVGLVGQLERHGQRRVLLLRPSTS